MNLETPTVRELLDSIGAKTPTPGGGAVASITAALGAALGMMVVNYSIGRKSLAEFDDLHREALRTLQELADAALDGAGKDAEAYGRLNALWKLKEEDERRRREFPEAVGAAIDAPRQVMGTALGVLHLLKRLCGRSNRMLASDVAVAAILAEAGLRSAAWNVRINLPLLEDRDEATRIETEMEGDLARGRRLTEEIDGACGEPVN